MRKPIAALAALVLMTGCNQSAEATAGANSSASDEATATETAAPMEDDAASDAEQGQQAEDSARLTVAGTVNSLVLEMDPPIIVLTGDDGTKYIGNVAPSASDSVQDGVSGVGARTTLDCKPMPEPEGAEPGYTWLDDCKLAV